MGLGDVVRTNIDDGKLKAERIVILLFFFNGGPRNMIYQDGEHLPYSSHSVYLLDVRQFEGIQFKSLLREVCYSLLTDCVCFPFPIATLYDFSVRTRLLLHGAHRDSVKLRKMLQCPV